MSPGSVLPPVGCRAPTGFTGQDAATRRRCRSPPHTVRGGSDIDPSQGAMPPRTVDSHVNHHRCGQTTQSSNASSTTRRMARTDSARFASASRVRLPPAGAVPVRDGHIHLDAQRHPDIPGGYAFRECLPRGASAHARQAEVAHQGRRTRAELPFDGAIELAPAHRVSAATTRGPPTPPGRRGRRPGPSADPR